MDTRLVFFDEILIIDLNVGYRMGVKITHFGYFILAIGENVQLLLVKVLYIVLISVA